MNFFSAPHQMDFQFLCARRVAESNHGTELMMSAGGANLGSGGNALKLPPLSLVPPGAGLWFQQEASKARGRPEASSGEGEKQTSPCSPSPAAGWFPQQQQPVPTNMSNKEVVEPSKQAPAQQQTAAGVWFQPEPQDDSTNVNVVSTNDSGADDSDEEDEETSGNTNQPPSSNNPTTTPPQPPTPAMSPWFLAHKNKDKADGVPLSANSGPWFLGKQDTANSAGTKVHDNVNNKPSNGHTNNDGPWYLGQHKIAVNPEHKQSGKPTEDDEGPWFLGQTKSTEPRDPHKQNGLWFHASDIKVEQGDRAEEDKRPEDASKGGCVWFGYNSLLKPDDNARGDISKMMSWFGSGHMMRPDIVKQEGEGRAGAAGTIAPGGFWFLPSSSAAGNCNGGGGTGGKMLECDQCQTPFRQRDRLREHRRIHALGETPHTCPVCEKAFTTAAARECHAAVAHLNNAGHSGTCRFCDTGDNHNHHMDHDGGMHNPDGSQQPLRRQGGGIRRPGGPGGYECKMCGLRFPDGPALTEHVDHHPGGRPLLCRLCCKTFKSKLGLENHTRLHTGERPFECGECGARFPQRAALDYHVKGRHTGENHRTCGRCGKLFRSTPGYNNHMRLHAVRDSASVNNNAAAVAAAAAAAAGGNVNNIVGGVLGSVGHNKEYHPH